MKNGQINLNTKTKKSISFKRNYLNMLYMLPVTLGIVCFTLIPMISSLVYSLCDYVPADRLNPISNFGFQNYKLIFTQDFQSVLNSFYVTFRFTIVAGGLTFVGSYLVALCLNQKMKGIGVFRIIYYIPSLVPAVAGSLLWNNITAGNGFFNQILVGLGFDAYPFYSENETIFPTLCMLTVFGLGGNSVMWLAQMKNIPNDLYEAASLDGANSFKKFLHITLPMTTPMIFYLMIMSIITSLQSFSYYPIYTLQGSPSELNFIVIKIYTEFMTLKNYSYACALSWVLFFVIGLLTLTIFKKSKWVYYGEES